MKLYLARHGEAVTKQEDPDRPLSGDGRRDVSHVADILEKTNAAVDRVIHSGKLRARQTAEILAQSVMREVGLETVPDMNPMDPVEPWVKKIEGFEQDAMLVGHMPFMGKLVSRLVIGREDADLVFFHAGAVVCLERTGSGRWGIIGMIRSAL
jgi:phosphohistidine phosphatase